MRRHTRRQLLGATASLVGAGVLAGCTGNSDNSNASGGNASGGGGNMTAQSSFFVFGDFASHVAGDTATANTLVPVGQHGHGWEPGPQIQGAVLDSNLFIYAMEGFQPWADDLIATLREDEANVSVVAAGAGVDLLEEGEDEEYDHANESAGNESHEGESEHEGHDHANESAGNESHEGEHETEGEHEEHDHANESAGNESHEGESEHDHANESAGNESHEGDSHNHSHPGGMDPHFWLDPMRAKQAVSNIRQGFVDIDSANADAYATNADQYRSRLDELDSTIQSALGNRSTDVVLIAGHNAFAYLGERYGFEAEALTGLSPDDQPTPQDIERAQEIINEHDLDYVLADPLESQRAAEQLVAETSAQEVLPLSPMPGQTQQWADKGWGYVEIMENVNLPTLERALGTQ